MRNLERVVCSLSETLPKLNNIAHKGGILVRPVTDHERVELNPIFETSTVGRLDYRDKEGDNINIKGQF